MSIVDPEKLEQLFEATPTLSARAKKQLLDANKPKPEKPVRGNGAPPRAALDFGEL